jgi:hypothetical protein
VTDSLEAQASLATGGGITAVAERFAPAPICCS